MICPEHDTDVEQCNCQAAQSLIELSRNHTPDDLSQEQAEQYALELYWQSMVKQRKRLDNQP
jgi:hypothetical protein